jgi:hypothetical protein
MKDEVDGDQEIGCGRFIPVKQVCQKMMILSS